MNIIKPKKISKGDTITIIAPSGNVKDENILNAKIYFENKGYRVKLGNSVFNKFRYMAGTDEERAKDLTDAFLDPETDAIICARGGYGAIRILDKIDYSAISNNPKIFCGYSDITALSAIIYKKTGLVTFSSPMPKGDFQIDSINSYTEEHFWNILNGQILQIVSDDLKSYREGHAQGILFGGNLSTMASLCGLDFIPDEPFIFFAEDLNESVYKIDRSFSQLINIDKFKNNIKALVLGDFLDVENYAQLDELFYEISANLNIPCYGGYKISHSPVKCTVPFGVEAILDEGVISFQNPLI